MGRNKTVFDINLRTLKAKISGESQTVNISEKNLNGKTKKYNLFQVHLNNQIFYYRIEYN